MVVRIVLIGKNYMVNKTQRYLENNNPDTFFIVKIGGFDYGKERILYG